MESILDKDPSRSALPSPRPQHPEAIGTQMSRRAKIASAAALSAILTLALLFLWLMSSLPRIEGRMPLKGLDLPATISRDSHGIPHITARSVHDAYFVLGWVHAQDRMWQMELQRRVAAGRLAEIIGEKGLPNDRFMRKLGLHRLAEADVAELDKPTRDALDAYSEGVNTWIAANRHRLPMEFMVLGAHPEPWRPADTLAWGRLMAMRLVGNWQDDILRSTLAGRLSAGELGDLFPGYAADQPTTLSARTADSVLAALPPTAEPYLASNVWVVDGRHTASGKPLLANDPHLPFRAPILWYLATIDAPGLTVSGATVPGVPFHLAGRNQRIAWGVTTTHADTVDLFVEKLSPDGKRYLTPEGWRPVVERREVIKVKGRADEVITVRQTGHGPVIAGAAAGLAGPGEAVALRATALEPVDLTAQAMLHLQRAVDWRGFTAALKDFQSPVQNFAFADTAGNIGFITAGRVPLRKSGDGSQPARGWTGEGDWQGWVPFAGLPKTYNPASGIIVNANNKVTPAGYPYTISADWPDGYRAKRITQMLEGRSALTPADMAAMQLDTLSLAALDLKPLLAGARPKSALARRAAQLVAAWDGHADRQRPEPLIFNAWMRQLWADILSPRLGETDFAAFGPLRPAVLRAMLSTGHHWCRNSGPAHPSCDALLADSLEKAVAHLAERHGPDPLTWKWGDEHHAVFANPVLDNVPLVSRFSHLEIPTDGDDFTVNRGSFAGKGFDHLHGAGLRAVYDLANPAASRFIIATGQSGNVLSRHYGDLLRAWRDNRGMAIASDSSAENAVLELEPE